MAARIKVFSFNLRVISKSDGINIFENRKERVLETIKKHSPDLIGFQEATDEMNSFLREALDGYTLIGCGRNADLHGERVPLAFKTEMFEMISSECFWLSPTPSVPGSRYEDQSSCPRVTTAALLCHRDSGEPFRFINTHLDHKGSGARLLGANQLINYICSHSEKFVMTGDFNATPDSDEIVALSSHPRITNITESIGGTFHGFGRYAEDEMRQIDYIFSDMKSDSGEAFAVTDGAIDGIYISDHRPICAITEH